MKKKYLLGLTFLLLIGCGTTTNSSLNDSLSSSSSSSSSSVFIPTPRPINEDVVDVYFIAGQSNAAGYSDFYRSDLETLNLGKEYLPKSQEYINGYDNILYYGKALTGSGGGNSVNELTPVKAGLGNTAGREIGAELGMAEYLAERYEGTDKKVIIIKHAMGASGLMINTSASQQWSAPSYPNPEIGSEKNLFHQMCGTEANNYSDGTIYKGLSKAIESGLTNFSFKGLFWAQGEAETDATILNYGDALSSLIGDFRTYINNLSTSISNVNTNVTFENASKMPFIIAEVCASYNKSYALSDNTSSREYINTIVSQEKEVALADANVETLETYMYNIMTNPTGFKSKIEDGISYCGDAYHYNADDMIDIGNRVAEMLYTFEIDKGKCVHSFDNYTVEDDLHTLYCSKCLDYKSVNHEYATKYDENYHFGECFCGHRTKNEEHVPYVVSSKTYEIGEELDKSTFSISNDCACGYHFKNVSALDFTLSEQTASLNTKINYTYNGVNYEMGVPLNNYQLEAESSNINNNQANYQVSFENYEVEEAMGQNGTASVGSKSMFGGTVNTDDNGNPLYGDTKITIKVNSDSKRTLSLSMLASSTYNKKVGFLLEDACDLYFNGKSINFDDDATFKGGKVDWFSWEEVHIKNFTLVPGENVIEIFVNYKPIMIQKSGQGPFNIDYFTFKYL